MTTKPQIDMKELVKKMIEENDAPLGRDYTKERHKFFKDKTMDDIRKGCYEAQEKRDRGEIP